MMTSTGAMETHFNDFSEEASIVVLEGLLYSCSKLSLIEKDDPFWIVFVIKVWTSKAGGKGG
jgi:hypothetical protein